MESRRLPQRISCCPKHFWSCTRKISLPPSHTILMDTLLLITRVHNFVKLCTFMLLLWIQLSEDLTWGMTEQSQYVQWTQQRVGGAQYLSWASLCCTQSPYILQSMHLIYSNGLNANWFGQGSFQWWSQGSVWFRLHWRLNPFPVLLISFYDLGCSTGLTLNLWM